MHLLYTQCAECQPLSLHKQNIKDVVAAVGEFKHIAIQVEKAGCNGCKQGQANCVIADKGY